MYVYDVYIYIYIERDIERERETCIRTNVEILARENPCRAGAHAPVPEGGPHVDGPPGGHLI